MAYTEEQFLGARDRAKNRIEAYFVARGKKAEDHYVRNMNQRMYAAADRLIQGLNPLMAKLLGGDDPVQYLACCIQEEAEKPQPSKRKAEYRYVLEMLADELGIHDEVIKVLSVPAPSKGCP